MGVRHDPAHTAFSTLQAHVVADVDSLALLDLSGCGGWAFIPWWMLTTFMG